MKTLNLQKSQKDKWTLKKETNKMKIKFTATPRPKEFKQPATATRKRVKTLDLF